MIFPPFGFVIVCTVIGFAKILACLKTPSSQPIKTSESLIFENLRADPSFVSPEVKAVKVGLPEDTIFLLILAFLYKTTIISFNLGCKWHGAAHGPGPAGIADDKSSHDAPLFLDLRKSPY